MLPAIIFIAALCHFIPSPIAADDSSVSSAGCFECPPPVKLGAHQFYIGPEIYHVTRWKHGSTTISGEAYGVRLGYEHIRRYKLYWGLEGQYGQGRLKGTSSIDDKIKSKFIDSFIEGRLGYTFQQKYGYRFLVTPYAGLGYAAETNNFIRPSPLRIHFQIRYSYVCAGFLSQISLSPKFDVGVNFKVKYMLQAKNYATHDADFEDTKMLVKERFHYRVEGPLTYHVCEQLLLRLVPFYEYRHYGAHVNFPFNFADTQLSIYGATLKLVYCL